MLTRDQGLFSIAVAVIVFLGLPNDPSNAYFLSAEEKQLMQIRAMQRAAYMGSEHFSWKEVKIAVTDPKVLLRYTEFQIQRYSKTDTCQQWLHPVLSGHPALRIQHVLA